MHNTVKMWSIFLTSGWMKIIWRFIMMASFPSYILWQLNFICAFDQKWHCSSCTAAALKTQVALLHSCAKGVLQCSVEVFCSSCIKLQLEEDLSLPQYKHDCTTVWTLKSFSSSSLQHFEAWVLLKEAFWRTMQSVYWSPSQCSLSLLNLQLQICKG